MTSSSSSALASGPGGGSAWRHYKTHDVLGESGAASLIGIFASKPSRHSGREYQAEEDQAEAVERDARALMLAGEALTWAAPPEVPPPDFAVVEDVGALPRSGPPSLRAELSVYIARPDAGALHEARILGPRRRSAAEARRDGVELLAEAFRTAARDPELRSVHRLSRELRWRQRRSDELLVEVAEVQERRLPEHELVQPADKGKFKTTAEWFHAKDRLEEPERFAPRGPGWSPEGRGTATPRLPGIWMKLERQNAEGRYAPWLYFNATSGRYFRQRAGTSLWMQTGAPHSPAAHPAAALSHASLCLPSSAAAASPGARKDDLAVALPDLARTGSLLKQPLPFVDKPAALYLLVDGLRGSAMASEFCAKRFHSYFLTLLSASPGTLGDEELLALVQEALDAMDGLLLESPARYAGCGLAVAVVLGRRVAVCTLGGCRAMLCAPAATSASAAALEAPRTSGSPTASAWKARSLACAADGGTIEEAAAADRCRLCFAGAPPLPVRRAAVAAAAAGGAAVPVAYGSTPGLGLGTHGDVSNAGGDTGIEGSHGGACDAVEFSGGAVDAVFGANEAASELATAASTEDRVLRFVARAAHPFASLRLSAAEVPVAGAARRALQELEASLAISAGSARDGHSAEAAGVGLREANAFARGGLQEVASLVETMVAVDAFAAQRLAELFYALDEEMGVPSPKRAAALLGVEPGCGEAAAQAAVETRYRALLDALAPVAPDLIARGDRALREVADAAARPPNSVWLPNRQVLSSPAVTVSRALGLRDLKRPMPLVGTEVSGEVLHFPFGLSCLVLMTDGARRLSDCQVADVVGKHVWRPRAACLQLASDASPAADESVGVLALFAEASASAVDEASQARASTAGSSPSGGGSAAGASVTTAPMKRRRTGGTSHEEPMQGAGASGPAGSGRPQRIRVAHVLLRLPLGAGTGATAATADPLSRRPPPPDRTQLQAEHILLKLLKGVLEEETPEGRSARFLAAAREISDCKSAVSPGGDLGWVSPGHCGKEFETVAFDLPIGGFSDIVATPRGVHIIHRLA